MSVQQHCTDTMRQTSQCPKNAGLKKLFKIPNLELAKWENWVPTFISVFLCRYRFQCPFISLWKKKVVSQKSKLTFVLLFSSSTYKKVKYIHKAEIDLLDISTKIAINLQITFKETSTLLWTIIDVLIRAVKFFRTHLKKNSYRASSKNMSFRTFR